VSFLRLDLYFSSSLGATLRALACDNRPDAAEFLIRLRSNGEQIRRAKADPRLG
jgi:hypothetical protein